METGDQVDARRADTSGDLSTWYVSVSLSAVYRTANRKEVASEEDESFEEVLVARGAAIMVAPEGAVPKIMPLELLYHIRKLGMGGVSQGLGRRTAGLGSAHTVAVGQPALPRASRESTRRRNSEVVTVYGRVGARGFILLRLAGSNFECRHGEAKKGRCSGWLRIVGLPINK